MVRCERDEAVNGSDIERGLVNGLLIALPLWVIIGVVLAVVFKHGPMGEAGSAALMIAAVCEAILLRPYMRTVRTRILSYAEFRRADPERDSGARRLRHVRPAAAPHGLFRRTLALSALVGAYLQYYFVEVNLQIASMHSITIFVPVT